MKNPFFHSSLWSSKRSLPVPFLIIGTLSLFFLAFMAGSVYSQDAINIHNGMPNRISMNVTVAKQTQGATFGEKVNSGLHAAGSAIAQGVALLGNTIPGAGIVSAALLKADKEEKIWEIKNPGNNFTLPETAEPGDYDLTIVVATENGSQDILKTRLTLGILDGEKGSTMVVSAISTLAGNHPGGASSASYAATGRGRGSGIPREKRIGNSYFIYLNGIEYALVTPKSKHDTARNSISNVR